MFYERKLKILSFSPQFCEFLCLFQPFHGNILLTKSRTAALKLSRVLS